MDTRTVEQPMLFISDAHLGGFSESENNRIESELIQLLNYCQRNKIGLTILGDLFDYWMEYPQETPKIGQKLLKRFSSFNKAMGPTLFITGNHDNWTRDHLTNMGFHLQHEHQYLVAGNHKIMALHGDGLTDKSLNLPRPLMHRILRNSTFINWYQKLLPPSWGISAMKYFSKVTRHLDFDTEKERKLTKWARQILADRDIDIILCGHDHIPRKEQFDFGTYINLGTFYQHRTMAYYNNDTISLVSWVPQMQSIEPFE